MNHQKVPFLGWGLVPSDGRKIQISIIINSGLKRRDTKMACDMEVEIIGRNCMEMTDSIAQMSYNNCFSQRGSLSQSPFVSATSWKIAGKRETVNDQFRPNELVGGKRKHEMGLQYTSTAGSNVDCNSLSDSRGPAKKVLTYVIEIHSKLSLDENRMAISVLELFLDIC